MTKKLDEAKLLKTIESYFDDSNEGSDIVFHRLNDSPDSMTARACALAGPEYLEQFTSGLLDCDDHFTQTLAGCALAQVNWVEVADNLKD